VLPILGQELVTRVDERRQFEGAQGPAEWPGELEFRKEHHSTTTIAGDCGAVPQDEPPTFAVLFLRHRGEQLLSVLVGEPNQRQRLAAVERGDDPRRPTAEPSAAGVQQYRAPERSVGRLARVHGLHLHRCVKYAT
jgi:hypothetical protein